MSDLHDNPMGTDGFEFVEYTAPDPQLLRTLFERLGFPAVGAASLEERHAAPPGRHQLHHQRRAESLRAGVCARARAVAPAPWRFACAMRAGAYRRALELGAKPGPQSAGPMELNIPCIEGIGGSLIYLVDRYGERSIYDVDFRTRRAARGAPTSAGLDAASIT